MDFFSDRLMVTGSDFGDGRVRMTVVGDLDALQAAAFRRHLMAMLPRDRVHRLEVDMEQVTFLDAAGMREVLRLRQVAAERGQQLVITAASLPVDLVLTLVGQRDLLQDPRRAHGCHRTSATER